MNDSPWECDVVFVPMTMVLSHPSCMFCTGAGCEEELRPSGADANFVRLTIGSRRLRLGAAP